MTRPLALAEAARLARVTEDDVRRALDDGDLRSLDHAAVDAWARARVAGHVARSLRP